MATISRSRTLSAPPEAVWDVLADFGAISEWAANVDHSCILEHGADGLTGTSRRVQSGRYTLVERITDAEAPHALGYDIEGLPQQLRRVTNRWTLEPSPQGGTAVTLTSTVDIGTSAIARISERVMCRMMGKQSDMMLNGLADRLQK